MVIESISLDQEGWYRHQAIDSRGSAIKDVYIKVVPGEIVFWNCCKKVKVG